MVSGETTGPVMAVNQVRVALLEAESPRVRYRAGSPTSGRSVEWI